MEHQIGLTRNRETLETAMSAARTPVRTVPRAPDGSSERCGSAGSAGVMHDGAPGSRCAKRAEDSEEDDLDVAAWIASANGGHMSANGQMGMDAKTRERPGPGAGADRDPAMSRSSAGPPGAARGTGARPGVKERQVRAGRRIEAAGEIRLAAVHPAGRRGADSRSIPGPCAVTSLKKATTAIRPARPPIPKRASWFDGSPGEHSANGDRQAFGGCHASGTARTELDTRAQGEGGGHERQAIHHPSNVYVATNNAATSAISRRHHGHRRQQEEEPEDAERRRSHDCQDADPRRRVPRTHAATTMVTTTKASPARPGPSGGTTRHSGQAWVARPSQLLDPVEPDVRTGER